MVEPSSSLDEFLEEKICPSMQRSCMRKKCLAFSTVNSIQYSCALLGWKIEENK